MLLHNTLASEAQYLTEQINTHLHFVGKPGNDLVSPQASTAFGKKIDTLRQELNSYVTALNSMADEMKKTAKTYGHTEQEILSSFTAFYGKFNPTVSPSHASVKPVPGLGGW